MKNTLFFISQLFFFISAYATSSAPLMHVDVHVADKASLQRGAKIYMNYCSGCHSLRYLRYNRMAKDLELTTFDGKINTHLLKSNLVFTKAEVSDPITISLSPVDARQWFGIIPPDLTLRARQRGADWLYTYLSSFYADDKRPFGANNLLVKDVAMPNVFAPLIGEKRLSADGTLMRVKPGELSPMAFDAMLKDLVTFLVYVSEPAQLVRYKIGILIMIFLSIFFIITYFLKKYYWRDVH